MFSFMISWFTCDSSGPSAAKCMQEREKKRKEKVHTHTLAHTLSPFGMTHFQVAMRLIPARAHMCKNIPDPGGAVHFFGFSPSPSRITKKHLYSVQLHCLCTNCGVGRRAGRTSVGQIDDVQPRRGQRLFDSPVGSSHDEGELLAC